MKLELSEERINKLGFIAGYFGVRRQNRKTIQECSELIDEMTKVEIPDRPNREGVVTEIADVWIMLQQMCFIHGLYDEVEAEIDRKLDRCVAKIKNGDFEKDMHAEGGTI